MTTAAATATNLAARSEQSSPSRIETMLEGLDAAAVYFFTGVLEAIRNGRPRRAVNAAQDFREYIGGPPLTVDERRSLRRFAAARSVEDMVGAAEKPIRIY